MSQEPSFPCDSGAVRDRHFDTSCLGLSVASPQGIPEPLYFQKPSDRQAQHDLHMSFDTLFGSLLIPVS
jgi:hypothetical protein